MGQDTAGNLEVAHVPCVEVLPMPADPECVGSLVVVGAQCEDSGLEKEG